MMKDKEVKDDTVMLGDARIEDAKVYQGDLAPIAKRYGLGVSVENKLHFPERIEVRLSG